MITRKLFKTAVQHPPGCIFYESTAMIISKEIKIKMPNEFSSSYIEKELENLGLDVLRWAVTASDGTYLTVDAAAVSDE